MNKFYSLIAIAITSISFAQTTVTKQFSDLGTATITSPSGIIDDNISFSTSQNSGTNPPAYYSSGGSPAIRLYVGSGNGCSLEFTFSNNITVTSVILNGTTGNVADASYFIDGSTTPTEISASNNTYTITGINATNSFKFQNTVNTASGNQIRISSLTFVYTIENTASPSLTTNIQSITDLNYTENEGPSTSQMFNISGENLNNTDVVITAPTNFEVSLNNNLFSQTATLPLFNGNETPIYVRLATGLEVDSYEGNITINGGGITTQLTIAVAGEVIEAEIPVTPELTVNTDELTGLDYAENEGPSTAQNFTLTGTDLDDTDVIIVAPENFEVSLNGTDFDSTITLASFDGTETSIYVRLASDLTINTYDGDLTISGGGIIEPISILVSGEVTETASIKENNIEGLKVYPNPATDIVYVSSNEIGTKEVVIYNVLGKKVLETSTNETINVANLTSGMYIMNITQDGKKATRKLVIK